MKPDRVGLDHPDHIFGTILDVYAAAGSTRTNDFIDNSRPCDHNRKLCGSSHNTPKFVTQIPWTLLPSSGMSCYSITAQDSSQTLIVVDHHPLNVLDEWSWSFSIFGTSMTSTMRTQDGLNISRRGTG